MHLLAELALPATLHKLSFNRLKTPVQSAYFFLDASPGPPNILTGSLLDINIDFDWYQEP
jgi:hypothetical protein